MERANGVDWLGGFQLRGARSHQTGEVKPGRGSRDQSRVRTPRKGQEKSQTENWKTQPSREPQKFPRGTAPPLDPTVTRQIQRRKKSQLSGRDSAEATLLNHNGVNETQPPRGEETITRRRPIRRPSHKEERRMESQHQDRGRF